MKWSDLLDKIRNALPDMAILCPACSDAELDLARLPSSTPSDITELSSCIACIAQNILEKSTVKRLYLDTLYGTMAIYVLEDVVIELGDEGGAIVPKSKISEYIELLKEMGVEIRSEDLMG